MELAYLKLLEYNTIISSSQYAQYYFSLRHAVPAPRGARGDENGSDSRESSSHGGVGGKTDAPSAGSPNDNFRSKYFMAIAVAGSSRLQEQSAAVAGGLQKGVGLGPRSQSQMMPPHHALDDALWGMTSRAGSEQGSEVTGTASIDTGPSPSPPAEEPPRRSPPPAQKPMDIQRVNDDDDSWGLQLFAPGRASSL